MQGPVTAVAFDGIGQHMLTTGVDGDIKVFDVRTFKMLHRYFSHAPVTSLDVSQRGLFASGFGKRIQARPHKLDHNIFQKAEAYFARQCATAVLPDMVWIACSCWPLNLNVQPFILALL